MKAIRPLLPALALWLTAACEGESFTVDRFVVDTDPYDEDDPTITDTSTDDVVSVKEMARRMRSSRAATVVSPDASSLKASFENSAFAVTFRGFGKDTDMHPLRPCVYENVTHVHVLFKKRKADDDRLAWSKLHIGTYRNADGKKCLVVFDSVHPGVCVKTCGPRFPDPSAVMADIRQGIESSARRAGEWMPATLAAGATAVVGGLVILALAL